MEILIPKKLYRIDPRYGPLLFFAGPVRGAGDWQRECAGLIRSHMENFYAAIPYYYTLTEQYPLAGQAMAGQKDGFVRQLDWERHYMEQAAAGGCLIFYLKSESEENPRSPEGGPYAMDTRGELGEWRGRLMHDQSLHVVVGADPDFPGLSQIQRNFNQALGRDFPIHDSLEQTVAAAVAMSKAPSALGLLSLLRMGGERLLNDLFDRFGRK